MSARATGFLLMFIAVVAGVIAPIAQIGYGLADVATLPAEAVLPTVAADPVAISALFYVRVVGAAALIAAAHALLGLLGPERPRSLTVVTQFGALGGLLLALDYLAWPFAATRLAAVYTDVADPAAQVAAGVVFEGMTAFLAGGLGSNLGWVFLAIWGTGLALAMRRSGCFPRWLGTVGVVLNPLFGLLQWLEWPAPGALGPLSTVLTVLFFVWLLVIGAVLVAARSASGPATAPAAPTGAGRR
jgi:hypothetical protein